MNNTIGVNPIKGCVGSGLLFGLKDDGTLYHNIVSGRRIYGAWSKGMSSTFIQMCQ